MINENAIDYKLINDYEFKIVLEVNGNKQEKRCIFEIKSKEIYCILDNIESDNVNIKIVKNPLDDIEMIDQKTIIFKGFADKEINTFVAGKLIKGKCEEYSKIYNFSFKESKIKSNITIEKNIILLKMKIPDKIAVCQIKSNMNYEESLYNLDCIIEGTNTCPIEDNDFDIVVGDEEPQAIRISSSLILYFSSFAGKNSIEYSLLVGNLIKPLISEIKECKYYFRFSNEFILDFFDKEILFSFYLLFNKKSVRSNCKLYKNKQQKVSILCSFDLGNECENKDLFKYDLEIGENMNITMEDLFYNIKLEGLNNLKTKTLVAGNIKDKYIENDNFTFILENIEKIDILKEQDKFNLEFVIPEKTQNIINAECMLFEDNNIKCESNIESLSKGNDLIIISNPKYQFLKEVSVYFEKFKDLRTFSIRAGQIQKNGCKEGQNYQFNLLNSITSESILSEAEFKINLKIDKEDNILKTAICEIKQKNLYSLNCIIEKVYCVEDIILEDNTVQENPNKDIFKPFTTFFYDFNNKRTITIIAGKLIKGKCNSYQKNTNI